MLVLERPCEAVTDIAPEEWVDLHTQIRRTTAALDLVFNPDQYNYSFLMNEDAQVHLHVIPRYKSSQVWEGIIFEDRQFGSLYATNTVELPPESLARLRDMIRSRLP